MFSKELRALNADPGSYLTRLVFGMCCLSLTTVMDTFILLKKKKWKESFLLSHVAVVITERVQV